MSAFSYYGSKSKIAHLYPAPEHRLIIEPFAGSASYSLRYADHNVWINDLDERVFLLWKFFTSDSSYDLMRDFLPEQLKAGHKVSEFPGLPQILYLLLEAECNRGTMGQNAKHQMVTKWAASSYNKEKLMSIPDLVCGWSVTNLDYRQLPNIEATWFIDPPYQNESGKRYRHSSRDLDFSELANFCRTRKGQVIVCENAGADWLDFQPLTSDRHGFYSRYQKELRGEVVWTSGKRAGFLGPSRRAKDLRTRGYGSLT